MLLSEKSFSQATTIFNFTKFKMLQWDSSKFPHAVKLNSNLHLSQKKIEELKINIFKVNCGMKLNIFKVNFGIWY